jgi:hypothetical protein
LVKEIDMAEFNKPGGTALQPQRSGQRSEHSGSMMEAVSDKARDLACGASEMAGQAKEQVQQWASSATESAEEAFGSVTRWVRRNPIPALLIVGGIGLLIALAITAEGYASTPRRNDFYRT